MANTFGEYIKTLRKDKSLREVAKHINISHTYLDSLEKGYDPRSGMKRSPSVMTVYNIAKFYNVPKEVLFDKVIGDEED